MFRVYVSSQDLAHFGSYGSKDGSNGQDDTFKHGTSQFHLSNSSDLRHFNAFQAFLWHFPLDFLHEISFAAVHHCRNVAKSCQSHAPSRCLCQCSAERRSGDAQLRSNRAQLIAQLKCVPVPFRIHMNPLFFMFVDVCWISKIDHAMVRPYSFF